MSEHDSRMPEGWHTIKSVLLTEINTAATFHHCVRAADALFHARLVGESCARENQRFAAANGCGEATARSPIAPQSASAEQPT